MLSDVLSDYTKFASISVAFDKFKNYKQVLYLTTEPLVVSLGADTPFSGCKFKD